MTGCLRTGASSVVLPTALRRRRVGRWQETTRSSLPGNWDRLRGPGATEAADCAKAERVARRQAQETERAAARPRLSRAGDHGDSRPEARDRAEQQRRDHGPGGLRHGCWPGLRPV
ncbi:hypothetical protein KPP03845_200121 (plasmid) [Streptomyces xanthophaeus]|nr:hypothetical protein KPP03845_200121 [Streptomyces xanthophaeus]